MVDTARRHDAGLFVLALTSNKEGPEVQHARTERRRTVADVGCSTTCASSTRARSPLGSFGAVVGATIGESALDFDFNGPILAPGFGAQGGTVADLRRIFGPSVGQRHRRARRASCCGAGPSVEAMRDEALRLNDELHALRS